MKRFIEGGDRGQTTLLPDSLEDYVAEDNPVRVVDVFIDELDLQDPPIDSPPMCACSMPRCLSNP